jgi:hypothetical protein
MAINSEKVDVMTLALLYFTTFKDKHGLRAWKSHSWDVLHRLHENGYSTSQQLRRVLDSDRGRGGAVKAPI